MEPGISLLNQNKKITMDKILSFNKKEYEKMMQLLDLQNNQEIDLDSDYFNAWNFGQSEDDYLFTTHSSIKK